MSYFTKSLDKSLWEDFQSYFEYKGKCSGCWCMNHRLPMGLDFEGQAAKLAMKELVMSNRVYGVLAYSEDDKVPIGWASLDRKKTLPGHDCIGDEIAVKSDIWSIHCITTREDYKNKGIERLMISAAVDLAKEMKAKEVEAYPEPESKEDAKFLTWNTFNGYQDIFSELGFEKIEKSFGEQGQFYFPMIKNLN